ncbi:MAG: sodium/glutamate symporter [Negativicutes bacterium]
MAFASGFLLAGQMLRAKVKFFQEYFIPSGLIAGALGFLFGPSILKLIPFSDKMGSYSGLLIILVFVSMGINGIETSRKKWKEGSERIGSFLCFKEVSYMIQYVVPILFAIYVLKQFWPDLHPGFGMIIGAGWAGGPGTAAAIGTTFAKYGWADATDLGITSATIGILTGIFGGIVLVKWAAKNKITNYVKDFSELPPELRTGLIPEEKRESMGTDTTSGISLESLAWHASMLFLPAGLGYLLVGYLSRNYHLEMPTFAVSFLTALVFSVFLKATGMKKYIDRNVTGAIAGAATDYLIFFGVASIKLSIIIKYAMPLTVLLLFGGALVIGSFLYFAPRMNKTDWFERSIFCFGYLTGVYANSFILSRIVDPDRKSKTFEDTALLSPLTSPVDIIVISVVPILLSTDRLWEFIIPGTAYMVFFMGLALMMKWWYPKLPLSRRGMAGQGSPDSEVTDQAIQVDASVEPAKA